jgi:hypothetical protein
MQIACAANPLHLLPDRFGPRPRSTVSLPFRQLEQFPPADIHRRLLELSVDMPHVHARQSRLASPNCVALCVDDAVSVGPLNSFIDGHEFCHLHPRPEGCIHVKLPPSVVEAVAALGWAERHPLHRLGLLDNLVMIYAPRDECELSVVLTLIDCARQFATGAHTFATIARSVA